MKKSVTNCIRIERWYIREFIAEVIGTFILVLFCCGSGAQFVLSRQAYSSPLTTMFAGGMGLTFAIYFVGGVSGGYVNPALTLAFCLCGRLPWKKLPLYNIAQVCGAFLAAFAVYVVYYDALNVYDGGVRKTYGPNATAAMFCSYPQPFVSTANGFADQVLGTFLLVALSLSITDERNLNPHPGVQPLALGLAVFAIGTSFAFNCGYPINPARDFGPRLFTSLAGWGKEPFSYRNYNWFWVPIVGPYTGAILAWLVYGTFIQNNWPPVLDKDKDKLVVDNIHLKNDTLIKTEQTNHGFNKDSLNLEQPDITHDVSPVFVTSF